MTMPTQTEQTYQITLRVGEREFPATLKAMDIFHEALEHAIPAELRRGHRLRIRTPKDEVVYPDMFVGETVAHFGTETFIVHAEPLTGAPGPFRTLAFDHLAITVADRPAARDFFHTVVGMAIMRDDPQQTVLTTGLTSLFIFGTAVAPLSDGIPSRWHHLGFIVDDLERCYHHLRAHGAEIVSDFTLLERDERWSLYCHYRNGDVVFMLQFSEIRDGYRGVNTDATQFMYDYLRGRYGVRFTDGE
jgi:catechol 2,3-dioxygenase-like lactoylglutathione lyase family enzyme